MLSISWKSDNYMGSNNEKTNIVITILEKEKNWEHQYNLRSKYICHVKNTENISFDTFSLREFTFIPQYYNINRVSEMKVFESRKNNNLKSLTYSFFLYISTK